MTRTIRVACYGTGNFARTTHLPNLRRLPGVEIVALCDVNEANLAAAGKEFGVSALYSNHHEMLDKEECDVLFSVVPAYVRTDCEITAAEKGVHLFIEKPQASNIRKAKEIDEAIRDSGVLSTVGFRERFRPSVEAAREFMQDKSFVHAALLGLHVMREGPGWYTRLDQMGGPVLDWAAHFIDQVRYITGAEVSTVQAFFVENPRASREADLPLSYCVNFRFDNGATANYSAVASLSSEPPDRGFALPHYLLAYDGGLLEVKYDLLNANGETIYQGEPSDPWFLSAEAFIEAVRSGDRSLIRNDFSDGLLTLAPLLAARHSAQHGGQLIDVREFAGL